MKKDVEILSTAVNKWGAKEQLIMLSEECSELSHAALKHRRNLNHSVPDEKLVKSFENLAEEIADVEIMIEQMRLAFNIGSMVSNFRKQKLERLAKKLGVKE